MIVLGLFISINGGPDTLSTTQELMINAVSTFYVDEGVHYSKSW